MLERSEQTRNACRSLGSAAWRLSVICAELLRSGLIGRQIDDAENGPRSGITDEVDALPIPVIVEVAPLQGI
jgi:hypothetical protein